MSAGSKIRVMAALLGLGCDRPPPVMQGQPDTARATSSDTVVRRVTRFVGAPSAIQRVTGAAAARRALQPIDSVLAVRVLDVRGDELPGARVAWSLLRGAPGARLTVANEVTDSAGESRARFHPGRSADPQVVSAEVTGVGRIDFAFSVPVARVELQAPRELWAGESVVVEATLRDSAGTALDDGSVQWATTDSTALSLARSDSARVVVTAALAGPAELWAWSGNVRGRASVLVRPVLGLSVVTLDGAEPRVRARITAPEERELTTSGGRWSAQLRLAPGAAVELDIAPLDSAGHHPARLRVSNPRELQGLRVALVPRRFRIDSGSFAGHELPIDATAALSPVAGRAPFWRMAPASGRGLRTLLGWHVSRLPIPIAFDRASSPGAITAGDSAAFWDIARQLERDLGSSFFRPAGTSDPDAVRVEIRGTGAAGHTFTSSTGDGNVNDGTLLFRAASTLRDPHVVTHELVHLLGFGHSDSWQTVAMPSGGREPRVTPQDVAYIRLALLLRRSGLTIGFPRRP